MLSRAAGNYWALFASHSCTISFYCTIYLYFGIAVTGNATSV